MSSSLTRHTVKKLQSAYGRSSCFPMGDPVFAHLFNDWLDIREVFMKGP